MKQFYEQNSGMGMMPPGMAMGSLGALTAGRAPVGLLRPGVAPPLALMDEGLGLIDKAHINSYNEWLKLATVLKKMYPEAIQYFTEAIELDSKNRIYYANRFTAYMVAGFHNKAVDDAEMCIGIPLCATP